MDHQSPFAASDHQFSCHEVRQCGFVFQVEHQIIGFQILGRVSASRVWSVYLYEQPQPRCAKSQGRLEAARKNHLSIGRSNGLGFKLIMSSRLIVGCSTMQRWVPPGPWRSTNHADGELSVRTGPDWLRRTGGPGNARLSRSPHSPAFPRSHICHCTDRRFYWIVAYWVVTWSGLFFDQHSWRNNLHTARIVLTEAWWSTNSTHQCLLHRCHPSHLTFCSSETDAIMQGTQVGGRCVAERCQVKPTICLAELTFVVLVSVQFRYRYGPASIKNWQLQAISWSSYSLDYLEYQYALCPL